MLHTPAVCPDAVRRRIRAGFTLIELLVVIAIVATLAAIAFGIVQGVRQSAASARARADLAALSGALAQYQRHFGDYPQVADTPEKLLEALAGRTAPAGNTVHGPDFLFGLSVNLNDPDHPEAAGNYFVDPWGRPYQYVYFTRMNGTAPLQRGFVLFSFGPRNSTESLPTLADAVPATSGRLGGVISAAPINARNIYAGQ